MYNSDCTYTILQIMPANEWWYVVKLNGQPLETYPLTGFALVAVDYHDDEPPEHTIMGIDMTCDGLYHLVELHDWGTSVVEYLPPPKQVA